MYVIVLKYEKCSDGEKDCKIEFYAKNQVEWNPISRKLSFGRLFNTKSLNWLGALMAHVIDQIAEQPATWSCNHMWLWRVGPWEHWSKASKYRAWQKTSSKNIGYVDPFILCCQYMLRRQALCHNFKPDVYWPLNSRSKSAKY